MGDDEVEMEIIGDPEAGEGTQEHVDPEGPGPADVPDPMPEDLVGEQPEAGDEIGDMDGQAPTS